ncbi:uncharacterized protein MAM_05589 [Metarhizium album ARSEF 1941]|uniref:Uncharacterized protein n=1 Tax=Metarhizium album (strain ARSEF 1941) TaxID=1081103 RepID=A0A0B2WKR0_METAS|nr:uncharacterized protein MAM_05589 [Metarhizium album ARSEF 1941]KHN96646.1 hypothetical protein MAM_05589 [Metarhizium album ARSEF 1941]
MAAVTDLSAAQPTLQAEPLAFDGGKDPTTYTRVSESEAEPEPGEDHQEDLDNGEDVGEDSPGAEPSNQPEPKREENSRPSKKRKNKQKNKTNTHVEATNHEDDDKPVATPTASKKNKKKNSKKKNKGAASTPAIKEPQSDAKADEAPPREVEEEGVPTVEADSPAPEPPRHTIEEADTGVVMEDTPAVEEAAAGSEVPVPAVEEAEVVVMQQETVVAAEEPTTQKVSPEVPTTEAPAEEKAEEESQPGKSVSESEAPAPEVIAATTVEQAAPAAEIHLEAAMSDSKPETEAPEPEGLKEETPTPAATPEAATSSPEPGEVSQPEKAEEETAMAAEEPAAASTNADALAEVSTTEADAPPGTVTETEGKHGDEAATEASTETNPTEAKVSENTDPAPEEASVDKAAEGEHIDEKPAEELVTEAVVVEGLKGEVAAVDDTSPAPVPAAEGSLKLMEESDEAVTSEEPAKLVEEAAPTEVATEIETSAPEPATETPKESVAETTAPEESPNQCPEAEQTAAQEPDIQPAAVETAAQATPTGDEATEDLPSGDSLVTTETASEDKPPSGTVSAEGPTNDAMEESAAQEQEGQLTSTEASTLDEVKEKAKEEAPASTDPQALLTTGDAEASPDAGSSPAPESTPESKRESPVESAEVEMTAEEPATHEGLAGVAEPDTGDDAETAEPEPVPTCLNDGSESQKAVDGAIEEASQTEASTAAEAKLDDTEPDSQTEPASDSARAIEEPTAEEAKPEAIATEAALDEAVKEEERAAEPIEIPVSVSEEKEEPKQHPPDNATGAAELENDKTDTQTEDLNTVGPIEEDKPAQEIAAQAEITELTDMTTATSSQEDPSDPTNDGVEAATAPVDEPTATEMKPEELGADSSTAEAAEEVKIEETTTGAGQSVSGESAAAPVSDDVPETTEPQDEETLPEKPAVDESKPEDGAPDGTKDSEVSETDPTETQSAKPDELGAEDKDQPSAEAGAAEALAEESETSDTAGLTVEVATADEATTAAEISTRETKATKEPEPITNENTASVSESVTNEQDKQTEGSSLDNAETKLDKESAVSEGPDKADVRDAPAPDNEHSEPQSDSLSDEQVSTVIRGPGASGEETGVKELTDGAEEKPKPKESEETKESEDTSDTPALAAAPAELKEVAADTEVEEPSDTVVKTSDDQAAEEPNAEQTADIEEAVPVDDIVKPTDETTAVPATETTARSPDSTESETEGLAGDQPQEADVPVEPVEDKVEAAEVAAIPDFEETNSAAIVEPQEQEKEAVQDEDSTNIPEAPPETVEEEPAHNEEPVIDDVADTTGNLALTSDEDNAETDIMKEANEAPSDAIENNAAEPPASAVSVEDQEVAEESNVDDSASEAKPDLNVDAPHELLIEEDDGPADASFAEEQAPKEDALIPAEHGDENTDGLPTKDEAKTSDQIEVASEEDKEVVTVEATGEAFQDKVAPESATKVAEPNAAAEDVEDASPDPPTETGEPAQAETKEELVHAEDAVVAEKQPVPDPPSEPVEGEREEETEIDSKEEADILATQPVVEAEAKGPEPHTEVAEETTTKADIAEESDAVAADEASLGEAPDADETGAQVGSKDETEPTAEPAAEAQEPAASEELRAEGVAETEAVSPEAAAAEEGGANTEEAAAEVAEPEEAEPVSAVEVAEAETSDPDPEAAKSQKEPGALAAEELEPETEAEAKEPEPSHPLEPIEELKKGEAETEETEDYSPKAAAAAIAAGIAAAAGGAALAAAAGSKDGPVAPKTPEEEESKDTVGPIPRDGKLTPKSKKGEELHSFHDTPIEFLEPVEYTSSGRAGEDDGDGALMSPETEEAVELRPAATEVLNKATAATRKAPEHMVAEDLAMGAIEEVGTEESVLAAEQDPLVEQVSQRTPRSIPGPEAIPVEGPLLHPNEERNTMVSATEEQSLTKNDNLALAPASRTRPDQTAESAVLDDFKDELGQRAAIKLVLENISKESAATEEPVARAKEKHAMAVAEEETPPMAEDLLALDDTKDVLGLQNENEAFAADNAILEPVPAGSTKGLSSSVTQEPVLLDDPTKEVTPKAPEELESVEIEALDTAQKAPIVVDDTATDASVSPQVSEEAIPEVARASASCTASQEEELPHAGEPTLESTARPNSTAASSVATIPLDPEEYNAAAIEVFETASDQNLRSAVSEAAIVDEATKHPTTPKSADFVLDTGFQSYPGTDKLNLLDERNENPVEGPKPLLTKDLALVNIAQDVASVEDTISLDNSKVGLAHGAAQKSGVVPIRDAVAAAKAPAVLAQTADELDSGIKAESILATKPDTGSVTEVTQESILSQVSTDEAAIEGEPSIREVAGESDECIPLRAVDPIALAIMGGSLMMSDKSRTSSIVEGNVPPAKAPEETVPLDNKPEELVAQEAADAESEDVAPVIIDNSYKGTNTEVAEPIATDAEKSFEDNAAGLTQDDPLSESWALIEDAEDSKFKSAEESVIEQDVQGPCDPDSEDNATVDLSQPEIPDDASLVEETEAEVQELNTLEETLPDAAVESIVEVKEPDSDLSAEPSVGSVLEVAEIAAEDQTLGPSAEQAATALAMETSTERSRAETQAEMATSSQAVLVIPDIPKTKLEIDASPTESVERKDMAEIAVDQEPVVQAAAEALIEMRLSHEAATGDSPEQARFPDIDEEFVDASEEAQQEVDASVTAELVSSPLEDLDRRYPREMVVELLVEDGAPATGTAIKEHRKSSEEKVVQAESSTEKSGSRIVDIASASTGITALPCAAVAAAAGKLHDSMSNRLADLAVQYEKSLEPAEATQTEQLRDVTEAQEKLAPTGEISSRAATEPEVEPTHSPGLTAHASDVDSRAPTPAVFVPDLTMVDQQRNKTMKRKQKLAVRNAEDAVAAAVVIYATAEAFSPPASPKAGTFQDHEEEFSSVVSREIVEEDLTQLDTDLSADESSREPRASSGERERERHRRRRQSSHHSNRSSRSRGEEEHRESRRHSSHGSHGSRSHRRQSDDTREEASKSPPRTPKRRDSGVSGESSASSGKRRTPEEQAGHERRRAERQPSEQNSEHRGRSEPSEPSERSAHRDRRNNRDVDPPAERSHRSSRRHSHSSQHKSERVPSASAPVEREPVAQSSDKRFFELKNSEGIVGSGLRPTIAGEAKYEYEIEAPKRSNTTRSKPGAGRPSTDQSRPKSTKTRESTDAPRGSSSKGSTTTASEDNARRARKTERSKKGEEKKSSGLKGVLRRIFG